MAAPPLSTPLSQVLVAFTIELDNEFEHRFLEAGGGARVTSLTMWSNLLRFVEDGITVGELVAAAGMPRSSTYSTLGGVERWRYVSLGTSTGKREYYGSARGIKDDWMVRLTPAGSRAAAIWPALPSEIEKHWRQRFGAARIDELRAALEVVGDGIDVDLPRFLPIVASANGMALELDAPRWERGGKRPLVALLARTLMAYTLEFEERSPLALPLSENVVRVLDRDGVPVRELPALTGVSKEAVAMSLTVLGKTGCVEVEGSPASRRTIRLTNDGEKLRAELRRWQTRIARSWRARFGVDLVEQLRHSLESILEHPELSTGLEPYPDGWRASKPYAAQTQALLADPRTRLPHYPMVLHRGGWPDGS